MLQLWLGTLADATVLLGTLRVLRHFLGLECTHDLILDAPFALLVCTDNMAALDCGCVKDPLYIH